MSTALLDMAMSLSPLEIILMVIIVGLGFMKVKQDTNESDFNTKDNEGNLHPEIEKIVKERTAQIMLAKEDAEFAVEQKSQFVANTSHELRNPLQGIGGNLALAYKRVRKIPGTEDNKSIKAKSLATIEKAIANTHRLEDLLSRLLELTKMDRHKVKIKKSEFKVVELIEQTANPSEEDQIKLIYEDENLSEVMVDTDDTFVSQVIGNLVENAKKYSLDHQPIYVRLDKTNDNQFRIRVQNSGFGVPETERESIFEPFSQSSATERQVKGTGLGLTMSRKYALAIGGMLELTNPSAECTEFTFQFPISAP